MECRHERAQLIDAVLQCARVVRGGFEQAWQRLPKAIELRLRFSGPFVEYCCDVIPVMVELIESGARLRGGAGFPQPCNEQVRIHFGLIRKRIDRLEALQ